MPRKVTRKLQRDIKPDRKYQSVLVQRLINKSMLDGKKLVVCAEEVPCGSATAQLEEVNNIELAPVSEEQSVTDVLGKVTSGEADAGLVYTTDAKSAGDAVEVGDAAGRCGPGAAHRIAVGAARIVVDHQQGVAAVDRDFGAGDAVQIRHAAEVAVQQGPRARADLVVVGTAAGVLDGDVGAVVVDLFGDVVAVEVGAAHQDALGGRGAWQPCAGHDGQREQCGAECMCHGVLSLSWNPRYRCATNGASTVTKDVPASLSDGYRWRRYPDERSGTDAAGRR